jgi:hypothetical protein
MEPDPQCSCLYDIEGNRIYPDPGCRAFHL